MLNTKPNPGLTAHRWPSHQWDELTATGHWYYSLEKRLCQLNSKAAALCGLQADHNYSLEQLLKRVARQHRPLLLQELRSCLENSEKVSLKFLFNHPRHGLQWMKMIARARIQHDSNLMAVYGTIEQIDNEERYRHELQHRSHVLEGVNDAIICIDEKGIINYWNKGAEKIYGPTAGEMLGQYIGKLDARLGIERFYRLFRRKGVAMRNRWRFVKDGETLWVDMSSTPLFDHNGRLCGAITTSREVTTLLEDLRLQVRQKELAEKTSQMKSDFLSNMSHEIRTPLNGIIGTAELLAEEQHSEEVQSLIEMQKNSAYRLLETLNSILAMSKIEAEKGLYKVEDMPLKDSLDGIIENFYALARKKNIRLHHSVQDATLKILVHPASFKQVMNNLVQNAIKFTDEGEVKISVRSSDEQVWISICDTGCGVSDSFAPRLFEPFSQAESGKARKHQGSGLGLSLVKKYVSLMGGSVSFEHNVPQGSCFIVKLSRAHQ